MLINSPNISGSLTVTGNAIITGSLTVAGGINATITGSATTASYVEYSNVANKPTLVSGSSQVTYSGLSGIPSGIVSGSSQVSFNGITDKPTLVSGSEQVSFNGIVDKPTLVSGSSQITYSGLSSIPSGIVSGSAQIAALGYATTGSNTFQANQVITGSLFISQNLVVAGSSSIQYISSSVVDIADNIITVNAFNPGVRFGGLAVADSGSSPRVSGSILFDSIKDQWIFVHESSATTSSVLLMGPETYNDLGNETYLSANRLPKGSGIEHLRDSNITDTGTVVSVNSNTTVTGSFTVITGSAVELQVTNLGVNMGSALTDSHIISGSLRVNPNGLFVSGSGNVGIGTASPSWKLQVETTDITAALFRSNAASTILGIDNSAADGDPQLKFYINDVGTFTLGVDDSDGDKFKIGTSDLTTNTRLTIDGSGNVGIGTTSPGARLNIAGNLGAVVGAGGSAMRMTNTDTSNYASIGAGIVGVNNAGIQLSVDGTSRMVIDSIGNVGININAPTNLLHLAGNSATPSLRLGSISAGFHYDIGRENASTGDFLINATVSGTLQGTYFRLAQSGGAATFASSVTAQGGKSQLVASGGASAGAGISLNTGLSGTNRRNWFIGTEESVEGDFTIKSSTAAGGVGGSGDTRLAILNDGNVGIGITSPSQRLDIRSANTSGATGATIRIGSQNHGGSGDEFANLEFFWGDPDAAEVKAKIYAKNVGNVGPGGGGAADLLFATTPAFGSSTERMRITSTGTVQPGANGTQDLGSTSFAWANIYTNDLHLSNMGKEGGNDIDGTSGTWTIQEGAEDLYIINNINNKKFRIKLEEII
jgi:hypothetical protein